MLDKKKFKIYRQLEDLLIFPSDTVLINLNIEKFGLLKDQKRSDYVNIFKEYFLSGGGTFIALAYTPVAVSITGRNLPYFDGTQRSYTGAFANAMLKDSDSYRSSHPSNSVVAIGDKAKDFVRNLDENGGAYDFCRRLIEEDGKILLTGMDSYPGFITHLVEQDLKLYRQYWSRFLMKVQLKDKVFKRLDPGGCSRSFDKLYKEYIKHEILRVRYVNEGYSLSISAKESYDIDYKIISKNPNILRCSDSECSTCRFYRWKTIHRVPFFVLRKLVKRIFK